MISRPPRLTYCMNVHPGERLADVDAALESCTQRVARVLAPRVGPAMGVGLWLSAATLEDLRAPGALATLRAGLARRGLHALTLNAFPQRGFHERRVKERVFRPAWDEEARLAYTLECAEVLDALLPAGVDGSLSTVPVGLAAEFDAERRARSIRALRLAGHALAQRARDHGRVLVLGLEPEPGGVLETVADAARFLEEEVLRGAGPELRAHLGVCLDACHEAVMHQDVVASLDLLRARGIALAKIQATAALEVPDPARNDAGLTRLRAFDEGRWFHQAVATRADGTRVLHQDLDRLFAAIEDPAERAALRTLRVHFHVPVFAAPGGGLDTTRNELERLLRRAASTHPDAIVEVETYTFDVIPDAERGALGARTLVDAICRELEWTADRFRTGP